MAVEASATGVAACPVAPGRAYLRSRAAVLLDWLAALWIFSGGFVLTEPSPYELGFLAVLALAMVAGFGVHRSTLGLLVLFVAFIPFALIAGFQVKYNDLVDALVFQAVTVFLLFTSYFVANYVADAPQRRMRLIVTAYIATAVIAAVVGTLGYLQLIPGGELVTRFGRAKGFFKDPNVYGPFLVLPAMYVLQRVLLGSHRRALIGGCLFLILTVGVFVSFSRAAWGHLAVSSLLVFVMVFVLEAQAREKVRMAMVAMAGVLVVVVALAGLLSIPTVSRLFEARAAAQTYDQGETGRFGRQGYAFELALEHPLGLGPNEFYRLRITEAPHNTYVTVLHAYGWGGGLIFWLFIGTTIWRGLSFVARPGPNRLLLIPLVAVFVPLSIEAVIIDVDHWRHFFLVAGLIWGVTASYQVVDRGRDGRRVAPI